MGLMAALIGACADDPTTGTDEPESAPAVTTATTAAPSTSLAADDPAVVEDAPVIEGTDWDVVNLDTAEFGFSNVWPDTEVTLSFRSDGTLSGFSGCNEFTGSYTTDGAYLADDPFGETEEGQAIAIGDLPTPGGGCDADTDEQEVDLYDALGRTIRWLWVDDLGQLILVGDGGRVLEAEPAG